MKKKYVIVNLALMVAVLFTMLVQSLHSFEHLRQLLQEKECHHKYTGKTEISHQHHPFDHCFVCEFTFGSYLSSGFLGYKTIEKQTPNLYSSFFPQAIVLSFKGSLFALRAPPAVV
ncbi:hypothetical protein G4D82_01915 [Flavobacterium sp. CYK-4]|uniref:hypothetical protein n=1 Tax=Flavobacterium lotistagni TaxID=2709660 RepID=UPI001407544D|nr:hypothetical protein [Flavobacterium lotistagni]NHM05965.1 hypothetical protein [Flavobacterium lotistagni]